MTIIALGFHPEVLSLCMVRHKTAMWDRIASFGREGLDMLDFFLVLIFMLLIVYVTYWMKDR